MSKKEEIPYPIAQMVGLLARAFPEDDFVTEPVLGIDGNTILALNLAALLAQPSTVIGTAAKDGQLVAVSVAIPKSEFDPSHLDLETAYVYYTAVEPSLQGRGLVTLASRSLESKLKSRGYAYLEQDCVKGNGYADTISRVYADAIVYQEDHIRYPENGPQRFFRIDLNRLSDR